MNIYEFIKQIQAITNNMTKEQLSLFVQEMFLSQPDSKREQNLNQLKKFENCNYKKDYIRDNLTLLYKDIINILNDIEKINSEKYCVNAIYYNCDDCAEFSSDNFVVKTINRIADIIHRCIDYHYFDNGKILIDAIFDMNIKIEYYEEYDLDSPDLTDISDIFEILIECDISFDFKTFVSDLIYYTYMSLTSNSERVERIFRFYDRQSFGGVTFDDVLKAYGSLPGYDNFIIEYIDYVCEHKNDETKIVNLIETSRCKENLLFFAKRHLNKCPCLILKYFKDNIDNLPLEDYITLGKNLIDAIPQSKQAHSELSILIANALEKMGRNNEKEKYWIEALYSDPSLVNYLRVRLFTNNWECYKTNVDGFYHKTLENGISSYNTETFLFDFFSGKVIENMSTKNIIQCDRYSFIKKHMSLFLLFFYNKNELSWVMSMILDKFMYEYNLKNLFDKDSEIVKELFWTKFVEWRRSQTISYATKSNYISDIKITLENEVDMNIATGKKSCYAFAALLIAAVGEVEQSNGDSEAKKYYINYFLDRYGNKRNFVKELKKYEY